MAINADILTFSLKALDKWAELRLYLQRPLLPARLPYCANRQSLKALPIHWAPRRAGSLQPTRRQTSPNREGMRFGLVGFGLMAKELIKGSKGNPL